MVPEKATERVCPRCGNPADLHAYCPECGYHLRAHGELPTAAEWQRSRPRPYPEVAGPVPAAPSRGYGGVSGGTALPLFLLALGLALGAFGVIRMTSGDGEAGRLKAQADSYRAQSLSLQAERRAIAKSAQSTDRSLTEFAISTEAVKKAFSAEVLALNKVVDALNADETDRAVRLAGSASDAVDEYVNRAGDAQDRLAAAHQAQTDLKAAIQDAR